MQEKMKRLRWQCRRGMLELDLLLLPFFDNCYSHLSGVDQVLFERLLGCQDPDLYQILIKHKPVEDPNLHRLIESILRGH